MYQIKLLNITLILNGLCIYYENISFHIFKRKRSKNILCSQKEAHVQEAKTLTIYL